jgi:hypothetical protein
MITELSIYIAVSDTTEFTGAHASALSVLGHVNGIRTSKHSNVDNSTIHHDVPWRLKI